MASWMCWRMRLPVRHMWMVSVATSTAAMIASSPSHSAWFAARWRSQPATTLTHDRRDHAPVHRRRQRGASGLAQVGEADRDDQEGLEAFAQGDDGGLQHGFRRVAGVWKPR